MKSRYPRQFHQLLLAFVLSFVPWFASVASNAPVLSGTVRRVIDGDTVDVQLDSGLIRVRLNAIDAPEKNQPWGKESTEYLAARITNKRIELEPTSQDRYARLVAVLYLDGVNINRELVGRGLAWAFREYMKQSDSGLCADEGNARQAKRGLWALKRTEIIAPWEFRKRKNMKAFTNYFTESTTGCTAAIGKR